MQTKTRLAALTLSAVFAAAFAAGPIWAETPKAMDSHAVTKMEKAATAEDEAAAAGDKAAEAVEEAKVAKDKALKAQGEEDIQEDISGSDQ